MKILDSLGRRRADRRYLCSSDLTGVVVEFVKDFEKGVHAVRAGEDDPIVGMRVLDQLGKRAQVAGGLDPDGGQLDYVGAKAAQLLG